MREKLAAVGLDEKEQRFYLAALELGSAPVTLVAMRAGVTRTNGYDLLNRLERRGLLAQVHGEEGIRQVIPTDPNILIKEWEQTRSMLDDLVPELRSMFNSTPRKPRIRFHEGEEGIQRALWSTLDCQSKHLYGILSMHELLEIPGPTWMDGYIAERIERGIQLDVVRSYSRETEPIWPAARSELRELRLAPSELDLGMTAYISDDTVVYISSKNENYALTIESRELASLQKSLFQSLWKLSKRYK
ncbi:TrmB family transcriptional regulator [Herbaspirillum sp. alder98]|uniref:TrmB family transcriptional regulator n=1 Tax=Herbaspirillum sp. alder98 TaxID=2913096 RepID=UPI001CD8C78A|nr:helix-turn-helix domain-containing protein [Herbaspirillum sp. alder98]MCA1326059.1 transcriptional regulator TrmB [Herbaspirillum sp. alder98]